MSRWQVKSVEENLFQNVLRDIHTKNEFAASMSVLADWYEENNNPKRSAAWRFLAKHERIPLNSGYFSWFSDRHTMQHGEQELQACLPEVWFSKLPADPSLEQDPEDDDLFDYGRTYRKRITAMEEAISAYEKLNSEEMSGLAGWTIESIRKTNKREFNRQRDQQIREQIDSGVDLVFVRKHWMYLRCKRKITEQELAVLIHIEDLAQCHLEEAPYTGTDETLAEECDLTSKELSRCLNTLTRKNLIRQEYVGESRFIFTDPTANGTIEVKNEEE